MVAQRFHQSRRQQLRHRLYHRRRHRVLVAHSRQQLQTRHRVVDDQPVRLRLLLQTQCDHRQVDQQSAVHRNLQQLLVLQKLLERLQHL